MFCPNCGAGEQSADAYCKRCGQWLPEVTGIARRALWGEGVTHEQRLKTILVRQVLSVVLAFASAILLFTSNSALGISSRLASVIAIVSLLIGAMQVDGFFITLRMRQSLTRNRGDAERASKPETQSRSGSLSEAETARLGGVKAASDEATRKPDSLPLERKRVE